jgi:hypothetical protein
MFGKATRTPKAGKHGKQTPRIVNTPGECVAVDQMETTIPGFIGQVKGPILTKLRYRYATIFVDQYSDYTFTYPMVKLTSEETLRAKKAFELHSQNMGVKIQNYHADNGRFQDNAFKNHCQEQRQGISYCAVNAHFQNGWAKKKIRDLQDSSRTCLLNATRKWPEVITPNIWPYALRYATDIHNHVPNKGKEQSPMQLFSGSTQSDRHNIRRFQPFGCPVYVLDSGLQAGNKANKKWSERARVGTNLGFSPQHSTSVHIIMSPKTGFV